MDIQVYINGKNAIDEFGIHLEDGALSALLSPPPMKPFIENKSSSRNGKEIYPANPHVDERDIQLPICITASSDSDFLNRYEKFIAELQTGVFRLRVISSGLDRTFNLVYLSCQQFTQYHMGLAKFILRLNEPDPSNRK